MEQEVLMQDLAAFRKATGCSFGTAREVLTAASPELREKIVHAASYQVGRLHDPIEDDPAHKAVLDFARQLAVEAAKAAGIEGRRGSCHFVWEEQAKVLRDQHQLVWHSPREMNPHVTFD